jgi:hypothetical protein
LEAFGPLDAVEGNLRRTVAHVSRSTQPRLEAGLELSYPRWIGSLRLG